MPALVRGDRVLTPDRELVDGWVVVEQDRIVEVGGGAAPAGLAGGPRHAVLAPGFVDVHNHGGGGAAFGDGPEAAIVARDAHLRKGTTTVVASLVTESIEVLTEQVRALRPLVEAGELGGIHLEGPWLSERWCGAHPPALLVDPATADVEALAAAAGDALVMVTLAPERDGALEATRLLVSCGVRVAVGHTDATFDQTRAAVEAGASVATHLYNGERPLHHREPGPTLALLTDERVWVETIADGVHQHPAVVRDTARRAGGRWVLVSDAMAAALADDGRYLLGRLDVQVLDGVARLVGEDGGPGSIAGSTLSMDRAVRTAVAAGVPLLQAVHAATAAPAAAMGWSDVGRLEAGRVADLVGLDDELHVQGVMRAGGWVAG
ncbi:N-acetylglucosamine-6-phosphate deacetylase [Ornithinimicrobium avium]|uniref:N-acetylglucosamine-6-phosphate deacetylase n=1 Tax=Ornithinimicrobium avium TaxID=2283195 RepID=UPI0013B3A147|nr:amidohydrolase family protein [Ornithinimicrobium avium]